MNVSTLDGRQIKWSPKMGTIIDKKSNNHLKVRALLRMMFPNAQILEEVKAPIRRSKYLYLDFYIPIFKLVVEVDGRQHSEFIPHFHKNKYNFIRSQGNDRDKEEWCSLNDLYFVRLIEGESIDEWHERVSLFRGN